MTAVRAALACLITGLVVGAAPAQAAESTWTVQAPHGPQAVVRHDDAAGTLSLEVTRGGQTVLQPSPLGLATSEADLSRGLRFLGRSDRRIADRYTTTVGKRRVRSVHTTESTFAFEGAGGARLDLVVRAARDGVAYRYVLPEPRGNVLGEAAA